FAMTSAMSNTDSPEGIYLEAKMHIKKDILLKCRVLPLMSTSSCTNSTVIEACRDEIAAFIGIADLLFRACTRMGKVKTSHLVCFSNIKTDFRSHQLHQIPSGVLLEYEDRFQKSSTSSNPISFG
ncbi:hypothetical protein Tco_1467951, partial [Tanacetum coccineum]